MTAGDGPSDETGVELLEEETADLLAFHEAVESRHEDAFEAAKELTPRLGAHLVDDHVEVGFWTPDVVGAGVPPGDVFLEVLTPAPGTPLDGSRERVTVRRERVPVRRRGEFHWAAVAGMRAGTRDRLGSLYRVAYRTDDGWETVQDPLGYSYPFGAFAPAELYDVGRLDETRADRDYFESLGTADERVSTSPDDGLPRVDPATSMLEIHPGTATEAGTLGGLARRYETVGERLRGDEPLPPADRNFAGYDAVQVMPVEPITQNPEAHEFWREHGDADATGEVEVTLARPELINWGYDIVVSGFSAPNPAILETGRPDELVDFIAACHSLPDPVKVVFDVALGHADNRGVELLPDDFFEGPGMYGKHLDYRHPVVRAILLEMQRRKMDFGADGIRVDGAQDFTYWDQAAEANVHDDAFLAEMDAITQEVAGTEYRPWMIYEDGRPWPREDWELASTYRALIEQHPHSFQWSPITFAHNTPALLTFWARKWWRVREVAEFGSHWITGVANHDTIRRGTQIDPDAEFNQSPVNPYLGDTLPDTLDEAYDSPAASSLFYCALPGVPMDFVHANMRAPWGFVRDTDADWNVKVVSDESTFARWQVRPHQYQRPEHFQRLNDLGFGNCEEVETFMRALSAAVDATDYDLETMAAMLSAMDGPLGDDLSAADLEAYGYAWMRDVHEFANLSHWADDQDDDRTAFDLGVRRFRQARPWLRRDVDPDREAFGYRHPANGTILYYALRESPDGDEQVLFAANMEGVPVDVSPATLAEEVPAVTTGGWEVALTAPRVARSGDGTAFSLGNAQAVVWTRQPP